MFSANAQMFNLHLKNPVQSDAPAAEDHMLAGRILGLSNILMRLADPSKLDKALAWAHDSRVMAYSKWASPNQTYIERYQEYLQTYCQLNTFERLDQAARYTYTDHNGFITESGLTSTKTEQLRVKVKQLGSAVSLR
jgi:hypothetical protein